jgi:hypothetical protein
MRVSATDVCGNGCYLQTMTTVGGDLAFVRTYSAFAEKGGSPPADLDLDFAQGSQSTPSARPAVAHANL